MSGRWGLLLVGRVRITYSRWGATTMTTLSPAEFLASRRSRGYHPYERLTGKIRTAGVTGNIGEAFAAIFARRCLGAGIGDIAHVRPCWPFRRRKSPDYLMRLGTLRDGSGELFLSPTFDHGAALARLLTDVERSERMETRDRNRSIATYASKARSACYADTAAEKTLETLTCFQAFVERSPEAAKEWIERLESIAENDVCEIISRVPARRMSDISKKFTLELLNENKKRILEAKIL